MAKYNYVDAIGSGETDSLVITGYCDVIITGLTTGSVKLQYMLPKTENYDTPTWIDFPDGEFTVDTMKTIYYSSTDIRFKLVGTSVDATCYYKLVRDNN